MLYQLALSDMATPEREPMWTAQSPSAEGFRVSRPR